MITGLLIQGAYLGGVYVAIEMGLPTGLTAIIVGLQPLLTALIAMLVFKDKLSIFQWGAMVLGLGGLALVFSENSAIEKISSNALIFACVALFGITIRTIYQKHFCQNQGLFISVFWQYFSCLFVFITISFWQQAPGIQWEAEFILTLTWLVLVLSVIAILLLLYIIEKGNSTKVSAYFYLVPPVTAFEAWLMFDETLTAFMLIGMLLCAMSVFGIIRSPKRL
jgi:drug/metabolite transporter (DMT)-like permease